MMKKGLLITSLAIFAVSMTPNIANSAMNYYQAPNAGNMNFYPLMQHQMEKEETLDFINNPEEYKQKREEKNVKQDFREGKTDVNPYLTPARLNIDAVNRQIPRAPQALEFVKDENGQIKIQGIK